MPKLFKIYRDGNAFCCVMSDFINLQVSPSGYGDTEQQALMDLLRCYPTEVSEHLLNYAEIDQ